MMIGPTKKFSGFFFSVECLDMHQESEGNYRAATGSPSPLFVQQRKAQAEDIPRSLFSFSPHDPDRGVAQEEGDMEGTGGGINGARGGDEQL